MVDGERVTAAMALEVSRRHLVRSGFCGNGNGRLATSQSKLFGMQTKWQGRYINGLWFWVDDDGEPLANQDGW